MMTLTDQSLSTFNLQYFMQHSSGGWLKPKYFYISVLISLLCSIVSAICLDIWTLNPADSHTLTTLLSQYVYLLELRVKAPYYRWMFETKTRDIKMVCN